MAKKRIERELSDLQRSGDCFVWQDGEGEADIDIEVFEKEVLDCIHEPFVILVRRELTDGESHDSYHWRVVVNRESFDRECLRLRVDFPSNYPFSAPTVHVIPNTHWNQITFTTRETGGERQYRHRYSKRLPYAPSTKWSPSTTMRQVLTNIRSLFSQCDDNVFYALALQINLLRNSIPSELRNLVMAYFTDCPTGTQFHSDEMFSFSQERARLNDSSIRNVFSFYHHFRHVNETEKDRFIAGFDALLRRYGEIQHWDTSRVTNMDFLFATLSDFNEDISGWDVSNVRSMKGMFANAIAFNQPIGLWDVGSVQDMSYLLYGAKAFNQSLTQWSAHIPSVKHRECMFQDLAGKPDWGTVCNEEEEEKGSGSEKSETMPIFVKALTGRTSTIYVSPSDCIGIARQSMDPPLEYVRLIFAGRELKLWRTFADYNIQREATIHLVMGGCIGCVHAKALERLIAEDSRNNELF